MSRLSGRGGEAGFTLIEMLIVISVIGILSAVAVPRFSNAITLANTARVQSDLSTLNTAIVMYQAENGAYPSNISPSLDSYIVDIANMRPPKGATCLLRDGTTIEITATEYTLSDDRTYALCQSHAASEFGKKDGA